jgi:calcineurin-like phosphoesterase
VAHKYESTADENKISGVVIDIDEETGCALNIKNFVFPEFNKTAGRILD